MKTARRCALHLSYSSVMATLALVVALGGTSYAALMITGANIKNGSLTNVDLRNNTVTGTKIKNGSVGSLDLSAAAKGTLAGPAGAPGAPGVAGTPGTNGAPAAKYWAVIKGSDGSLIRSSGVTGLLTFKYGGSPAGAYEITFGANNISACAYVGTLYSDTAGRGNAAPSGEIGITQLSTSPTNGLSVSTFDSTGALANHDFTVAVFC